MNLNKYNFRIQRDGFSVRLLFDDNGKVRTRKITRNEELEDDKLISSLYNYLETGVCDLHPIPSAFCSVKSFIKQRDSHEELMDTYEQIIDSYEQELSLVKDKLQDSLSTIMGLEGKLHSLSQRSTGVVLDECQLYHLYATLSDYRDMRYSDSGYTTGRKETIDLILNALTDRSYYEKNLTEQLRRIISNVTRVEQARKEFARIGFTLDVGEKKTHGKLYPTGKPELSVPYSCTPSDWRVSENLVQEVLKKVLR